MKEITIKSWSEFDRLVARKNYRKWLFRGQSNYEWSLQSSLSRCFDETEQIHQVRDVEETISNHYEHEQVMLDKFRCHAHLYLKNLPHEDDTLSWLCLMQHYGAPTRLLDFTFSPYVALYFALEAGTEDAAVYFINHDALIKDDIEIFDGSPEIAYRALFKSDTGVECLFSFEPKFSNERLLAQQGLLVAPNNLELTHELILQSYKHKENDFIKVRIPGKFRYSGLRKLNQMNINAANIYPGLEGFCRSLNRQPILGMQWLRRLGGNVL
ncbi:TPA: FRG domain-containing protein [Vibrio vulnificus]|uniref:FRG domain-containing protein n=1 Tax=Vibrio vulnificus TaxID=672 RepID=UPI00102B3D5D|nr:FRG domain-containing protein [Vibrio vulnificus]EGR0059086.1 FRG domain-containing protein [Vibrio vulnificus]EGR0791233.1 FRG domain-containing protein [Vibrio vulnificus]EGR0799879.1 FRG domain-containing protein [Vibrio vulnificus]EGR0817169.1 FRG domain-containing protein [Vibrio vulnificus]EGR0829367.1 FRG domain-containing protein [Vibrio vulnificus]